MATNISFYSKLTQKTTKMPRNTTTHKCLFTPQHTNVYFTVTLFSVCNTLAPKKLSGKIPQKTSDLNDSQDGKLSPSWSVLNRWLWNILLAYSWL